MLGEVMTYNMNHGIGGEVVPRELFQYVLIEVLGDVIALECPCLGNFHFNFWYVSAEAEKGFM